MRHHLVRLKIALIACLALGLLLPAYALSASPATGVPPRYAWHTFYGGLSPDYNINLAVDADGNSYLTGRSQDSWLGPTGQQPLHPYTGMYDLFVLKLDSSGGYLWHTFYGSSQDDRGFGAALDAQRNLYITGYSAAAWLGDGNIGPIHPFSTATGTTHNDIFVLKLGPEGAYQWHTFYGSSANESDDRGFAIAVTPAGDAYLTGYSNASWLGDGNIAPRHAYGAAEDIFALRLSSAGAYQWHTFYGSANTDSGLAITLDPVGGVYVAGHSAVTWLGDGNTAPRHAYTSGRDLLALKLASNGDYQWHTFYGGSGSDQGTGIAVSPSGDLYLSGYSNAAWQGPGSAAPLHPINSGYDLCLLKLNSSGDYLWHTFYGGTADDVSFAVALDGQAPLVIGYSLASWLGDGSASPQHAFTPGTLPTDTDLALLALDADGSYGWHTFYGSSGQDLGTSLAVSPLGAVIVAGTSAASWLGDGGAAPLHDHASAMDLFVMQLAFQRSYLPLMQK
jgi:hypothetical protein